MEDFIGRECTCGDPYSNSCVVHKKKAPKKPKVKLIGRSGNVFAIIGAVNKALERAGQVEQAKEFTNRAFNAGSYDKVLQLCMEYAEVR